MTSDVLNVEKRSQRIKCLARSVVLLVVTFLRTAA